METIIFDVKNHVATVTLNRPESLNAFNPKLSEDLLLCLLECEERKDVRAVVITGAGKAFCAGGDVKGMAGELDKSPSQFLKRVTHNLHAAISSITRMEKPVIAAVNGVAAGAGFSLAIACDMALASESARFTMAYTRIGLVPDGSSTYMLPRLIGLRKALELIYTNKVLSAKEAKELGLINRVIEDQNFSPEVEKFASELAKGPTLAFGLAKRLMQLGVNETLETQMENEREFIAKASKSEDFREGVLSFLEKREPGFRGE